MALRPVIRHVGLAVNMTMRSSTLARNLLAHTQITHSSRTRIPFRSIHRSSTLFDDATQKPPIPEQGPSSQPQVRPIPLQQPEPELPLPRRRSLRPYIWAISFFLSGLVGGSLMAAIIVPAPLPEPFSPEDEFMLAKIRKDISALPIVQELRTQKEHWLEYEAYMSMPPEAMANSMTAGTLQGSRGLGVQRVFWNREEKRSISVLFFGGALSGWPGVTHGGVIGTVLHENLERVANGPDFSPDAKELRLGQFKINYRKPTAANALYIIRAEVDDREEGVLSGEKVFVKASLEHALKGHVCADAEGYCSMDGGSTVDATKAEVEFLWTSTRRTLFG